MTELVDDQFYKILHKKYKELLLDFVLLQFDGTYLKETSHKEAVIEAISVFNSRLRVGNSLKHQKFYVEEDKMKCKKSSIEELLLDDNDDRIKTFEISKGSASISHQQSLYQMNFFPGFYIWLQCSKRNL